jgi:hypothetical protein
VQRAVSVRGAGASLCSSLSNMLALHLWMESKRFVLWDGSADVCVALVECLDEYMHQICSPVPFST